MSTQLELNTKSSFNKSNSDVSSSGSLGTYVCEISDTEKVSNNDTKYSSELWKNVLASEATQLLFKNKTMFGELDHPFDGRTETSINKAAVVTTDLWLEDNKLVGKFDVLDTPAGRIVNSLIDYGSMLGLSVRGVGTIEYDGEVDPDTYKLLGIDVVSCPSMDDSRIGKTTKLTESERVEIKPVVSSFIKEINNKSNTSSDLLNLSSLLESSRVDTKSKNKLKNLLSTKISELNESDTHDDSDKVAVLQESLQDALIKNSSLQDELMNTSSTDNISGILESVVQELNSTRLENAKLKKNLKSSSDESLSLRDQNYRLSESLIAYSKDAESINESDDSDEPEVEKDINSVILTKEESDAINQYIAKLESQTKAYQVSTDKLMKELASSTENNDSISAELSEAKVVNDGLLSEKESISKDLDVANTNLEESTKVVAKLRSDNESLSKLHKSEIDKLNSTIKSLNESIRTKESDNKVLLESYASMKFRMYNIDKNLYSYTSKDDVDKIVESSSTKSSKSDSIMDLFGTDQRFKVVDDQSDIKGLTESDGNEYDDDLTSVVALMEGFKSPNN